MKAGRLRHRVTVEDVTIELDSDGVRTETWADAFGQMLSAEIMPLSGRELIAAAAIQSRVSTRIKMRNRPGLVARMRIVHRETIYNIHAVIPDPDSGQRYVTLQCSAGPDEG